MSRSTAKDQRLRELREESACDGDPLLVRSVSVQGMGQSNDIPYLTPTVAGADIVGIASGDQVRVEVYPDRIVVKDDE